MAPLITLTTDFGTRDAYVAELKGVLYSEGPPGVAVVDLSHELAPFDVHAAALFVRAALPRFPQGAVHLCVVDPGVGSARRALIVERADMLLVGPDNGLFSYLYDGSEKVYTIERPRPASSTFHGRDVFAPVAARLAAGAAAGSFGARVDGYERLSLPMVDISGDTLHGRVIQIDHYGNLITNITRQTLTSFAGAAPLRIAIADRVIDGVVDHYAQAEGLLALIGSSGWLEVAAREASAAQLLDVKIGQWVRVLRSI
ncbi:MAG TPA: SAM-dependent chlorinase/fluorinase [Polyangiales bacterium]|nr:SAM-dependent chlorinase/fluorinase [Polyangiales bacterium]